MNRVSIIITNCNYGHYVAEAIESALRQTYENKEVIVVDDGSTDSSREVINRYGGRISAIFKDNGGQCTAANEGFEISRGDVVIFLDSDDILWRDAAAALAVPLAANSAVSRSQGYLLVVDKAGVATGKTIPRRLSASGDYLEATLKQGPAACRHPFTSGNAWARWYLEKVMPLPELDIGVDGCLSGLSTLFGRTESLDRIVGTYRVHDRNIGPINMRFTADSLQRFLERSDDSRNYLADWAERLGHSVPADRWRRRSADWRSRVVNHSLILMNARGGRTRLAEFVLAPFRSGHTRWPAALVVSLLLGVLWILPRRLALAMARRMLRLPKA